MLKSKTVKSKLHLIKIFQSLPDCYRPQTKLREGYVFTGVCDSVNRGVVSHHALHQHYMSSCTVVGSQLVRRQQTGNIKCMMGLVTWYPPGQTPQARHLPPQVRPLRWSLCGQYASHWNAFLLSLCLHGSFEHS